MPGTTVVMETKGQDTKQDKVKHRYPAEWTQAVNAHCGFGRWRCAVTQKPGEVRDILIEHDATKEGS
jgi:type III restriction enzyme